MITNILSNTEEYVLFGILLSFILTIFIIIIIKFYRDKLDYIGQPVNNEGLIPNEKSFTSICTDDASYYQSSSAGDATSQVSLHPQIYLPPNHHYQVNKQPIPYPLTPNPYICNQINEQRQIQQQQNYNQYMNHIRRPPPMSTPSGSVASGYSTSNCTITGDSGKSVTPKTRPAKIRKMEQTSSSVTSTPMKVMIPPPSDHETDQISDVADMMVSNIKDFIYKINIFQAVNQISSEDATRTVYPEARKPYNKPMPVSAEAIVPINADGSLKSADNALAGKGLLSQDNMEKNKNKIKPEQKLYIPVKSDTEMSDKKEPPSRSDDVKINKSDPTDISKTPTKTDENKTNKADQPSDVIKTPAKTDENKTNKPDPSDTNKAPVKTDEVKTVKSDTSDINKTTNKTDVEKDTISGKNTDVTQLTDPSAHSPRSNK